MKAYLIIENNEEEYEDYCEWVFEIYLDKEKAEKRFLDLIKKNKKLEDRTIRKVIYDEDIGAYRLKEHEIIE